ncbi:MAG: hypothetical protein KDB00_20230, partial [Planctomycetales bacterium]|nr:hypothetical protein [Planctomycetales bacterium]
TERKDLSDVREGVPESERDEHDGKIWLLKVNPGDSENVDLQWDRALSIEIAWQGELIPEGGETISLEAGLFTPLNTKNLKPVPYSAVAPKVAAVTLVDDLSAQSEIMQRTMLFGDAATTGPSSPRLVIRPPEGETSTIPNVIVFEATDDETIDIPLPTVSGQLGLSVILLKYMLNGQTIATGRQIIST